MNAQEYLKHWEQGEAAIRREHSSGSLERMVSQQRGFWRSPRGENHGLNSKPGDEWAHEGDVTDTDRLRWLVENMTEETAMLMPEDFGQAREYLDELMLANDPHERTGATTKTL